MTQTIHSDKTHPIDPTNTHPVLDFEHDKPLTCCKVSPSGRFVFAGAEDLNVHRWEIETGKKTTLVGHESWVRSMDFSPDGQWLYTAGWDGQIQYWSVETEQPTSMHMIQAHRGFARWIHTSPCGRMLTTCGNDKLVRIWEEATGRQMAEMAGHERHPYAVCFHPLDGTLASQDLMGNIFVWNSGEKRITDSISTVMTGYDKKFAADMGGARDMQFSPDGSQLACAGITNVVNSFAGQQDPIVVVTDWKTKTVTHHLKATEKKAGVMWGVRFHPDGFITGAVTQQSGKGDLLFWRMADAQSPVTEDKKADELEKPLELQAFHSVKLDKGARGFDFTPDHRRAAIAHTDGHLRIYELAEKPAAEKKKAPAV